VRQQFVGEIRHNYIFRCQVSSEYCVPKLLKSVDYSRSYSKIKREAKGYAFCDALYYKSMNWSQRLLTRDLFGVANFLVWNCTLLAYTVLSVWTWCLEQSASSAERHRCCLHLQASLEVWTFLSSLRRFDDCFNRCWTLRLIALLTDVFYWRLCVLSSF